MKPVSYVGITDFTDSKQIKRLQSLLLKHRKSNKRVLQAGVMMSYKTLRGIPTKWSVAFPPKEKIALIFIPLKGVMNTLHYVDYDGVDVVESILNATELGGPNMDALQLDMVWPPVYALKLYKSRYPRVKIILQVGAKSLKIIKSDSQCLIEYLGAYEDALDYVLLDKSMGRGRGMNAAGLLPFVEKIAADLPKLGITVAGGLGPTTLDLIKPIVSGYPNISIDAQGKLRPSRNSLDPIDWNMAEEYLVKSLNMLD